MVEHALDKKQTEVGSTSAQTWKISVIDLDKEWEKFNKKLQTCTNLDEKSKFQTPKQTQQKVNLETTEQGAINTQDIEVIPDFPTSEIVLKIEEIPPLDIFYIPTDKAMVKSQIKKGNQRP